jgi:glycerophosphoryl diester phosphodiesterase
MFFTGRAALANRQIVDFLLAPTGLLYGILLVVAVIALLLVEQACIMQIATAGPTNSVKPLRQRLPALLKTLGQIAKLGAIQAAILSLALAPLIVAAAITYWALLTEYDIYYYWKTRPTSFWLAIGVGLVLLAVATVVATLLLIRWAIALPLVLFTNTSASVALRESAQRLRGHAWRAGGLLVGWQLATWIVGLGAMGAFRLFAARWRMRYYWLAGHSPAPLGMD